MSEKGKTMLQRSKEKLHAGGCVSASSFVPISNFLVNIGLNQAVGLGQFNSSPYVCILNSGLT